MTGTLASLFGLAVLDSVNPSALAVTIFLLLRGKPYVAKVLTYISAVFLSYLGIGVLLMFGLGSVWGYVEGPGAYAVQGVVGALLFGYALLAPDRPRREKKPRTPRTMRLPAIFLLGVTITAVEFSTAFPYLGAIAILTNAEMAMSGWLPILVVYNVIFVLPPLLLLAAYGVFGSRVRSRFERWRDRFQNGSRKTLLWILGIVGFLLLADSLAFFDFLGLVEVSRGG